MLLVWHLSPNPCVGANKGNLRMDSFVFSIPIHVMVSIQTLNIDCSLRRGIPNFKGIIVERYYHHIHWAPMFTVNFEGGIGYSEVFVVDTILDAKCQFACIA
jgi:hypothetical protein